MVTWGQTAKIVARNKFFVAKQPTRQLYHFIVFHSKSTGDY